MAVELHHESPSARAWRRLLRRKSAVFGLVVIVLFVLIAIFAPLLTPYDPAQQSWTSIRKPPSLQHWFGTDESGRDLFSRVIFGARASLLAGVVSISIALGLGVPIGLLAGYGGRWIDAVISRITDAMLAIPFLILAIALAAFLGPSLQNAMIAIGLTATPIFVRLTRGQVMAVKVEDYVEAARAVGNPAMRIAFKHILPNILPALIVQATISIATAIIAEASLSFLGSASSRRRHRGARCSIRPSASSPTHRGWPSGRASRSFSSSCPSMSSATACAMRWTRKSADRVPSGAPAQSQSTLRRKSRSSRRALDSPVHCTWPRSSATVRSDSASARSRW